MQQSTKSHFLTTMSSNKSYLVKRKKLELSRSKQAKEYFHSPSYQEESCEDIVNKNNPSTVSIENACNNDSLITTDQKLLNKFTKIPLSNHLKNHQTEDILLHSQHLTMSEKYSLQNHTQNHFTRQRSAQSLIDTHNQKKIKQKKITFSTISDANFNKSLTKKEILVQDPSTNPQNITCLPKINKTISQKNKSQIYQKLKKIQISRNNLMISKNQPYHVLSKELVDKFSIQKFHNYKKIWAAKQQKRKQINNHEKNASLYKSFSFNVSILDKSDIKSSDIAIKYNEDAQHKRQRCFWEQQLRGNKRNYVTIGESSNQIKGLKGHGQNLLENIEVRPVYSIEKNNFLCEQVYRYHK